MGFGCTELDTRYIDIDRHDISRIDNLNRVAATLAASQTSTTTWKIAPAHSIPEFKVKHIMIANVKGQFSNVSGALFLDEANLANSGVDVSVGALLWRRAFLSASLIK